MVKEQSVGKGRFRITVGNAITYVRDGFLAINTVYLFLGLGLIALPFGMPGKWFGTVLIVLCMVLAIAKVLWNWHVNAKSLFEGFAFWKVKA